MRPVCPGFFQIAELSPHFQYLCPHFKAGSSLRGKHKNQPELEATRVWYSEGSLVPRLIPTIPSNH